MFCTSGWLMIIFYESYSITHWSFPCYTTTRMAERRKDGSWVVHFTWCCAGHHHHCLGHYQHQVSRWVASILKFLLSICLSHHPSSMMSLLMISTTYSLFSNTGESAIEPNRQHPHSIWSMIIYNILNQRTLTEPFYWNTNCNLNVKINSTQMKVIVYSFWRDLL